MFSAKNFAVPLVLGVCLAVSAQAGDNDKKETVLTEKNDKTTVKLAKDAVLAIKLEGNATTGFVWTVAKNNSDVLTYAGKLEMEKVNPGVLGGKAVMVLRFTAKAAGTSEIELAYKRPFEKDVPPAKVYKLKVEVTDSCAGGEARAGFYRF